MHPLRFALDYKPAHRWSVWSGLVAYLIFPDRSSDHGLLTHFQLGYGKYTMIPRTLPVLPFSWVDLSNDEALYLASTLAKQRYGKFREPGWVGSERIIQPNTDSSSYDIDNELIGLFVVFCSCYCKHRFPTGCSSGQFVRGKGCLSS